MVNEEITCFFITTRQHFQCKPDLHNPRVVLLLYRNYIIACWATNLAAQTRKWIYKRWGERD